MTCDRESRRIFAGGDGGVIKCWNTSDLCEIRAMGEESIQWSKKLQVSERIFPLWRGVQLTASIVFTFTYTFIFFLIYC